MPRFVKYLRSPDQFPGGFSFRPSTLLQSSHFFFLFFFLLSFFLFHFSSIVTLCIISIYFLSSSLRPHVSFIQSGTNGSEVMPSESSLEIILFAEKGARVYFFSSRRSGASQPRCRIPCERFFRLPPPSLSISFGSRKEEEFHRRWIVVEREGEAIGEWTR